ncbi:MAG: response regulator transcription factor [Chloroflexi bacterium]|nr:response regulator transcription factor [Chloroflexota bacterium]
MAKVRVLLADANPDVRESMRQVIEATGADVHLLEARDGREAMRTVFAARPHLVLADIKLAQVDTLTLVQHIRQRLPETRTIVLVTDDNREYRSAALIAGACAVLAKEALSEEWMRVMIVLMQVGSEVPCELSLKKGGQDGNGFQQAIDDSL